MTREGKRSGPTRMTKYVRRWIPSSVGNFPEARCLSELRTIYCLMTAGLHSCCCEWKLSRLTRSDIHLCASNQLPPPGPLGGGPCYRNA